MQISSLLSHALLFWAGTSLVRAAPQVTDSTDVATDLAAGTDTEATADLSADLPATTDVDTTTDVEADPTTGTDTEATPEPSADPAAGTDTDADTLASVEAANRQCRSPLIRKEWRRLTDDEKLCFINAVKCLQQKPAQLTADFSGSRSRYDDFQGVHISQTDFIHWVGSFLPWHRAFMNLFENELRNQCQYRGAIPYWDWTLDAGSEEDFLNSPLLDPVTGFGGNGPFVANTTGWMIDIPGRTGGGCLDNGPFANLTVNMGPDNILTFNPHCLVRDLSPSLFVKTGNQTIFDFCLASSTFFELDNRIEGLSLGIDGMTLHAAGHMATGDGIPNCSDVQMSSTYSSPGDPLFWLHHGGLDFTWWKWQQNDLSVRLTDIGGPDTQFAFPYNYFGDIPYQNVTLDTPLNLGGIGGTIKIGAVMNTEGGNLCYRYE
ncbi:Di-copper centre-containing protein [Thozetella sp. PMI_491]|nr:Di-copper centre-containing protein [Thozetella sp. PMI_491]